MNLWLDDSIHSRLFNWTADSKDYATLLSYDLVYKSILGVLPETLEKAKERNTSLFKRRLPANYVAKILSKQVKEDISGGGI